VAEVRVAIDGSVTGSMDFERWVPQTMVDGPAQVFNAAADELERIAADIRRMYPRGES
jgi:hypothetical protein